MIIIAIFRLLLGGVFLFTGISKIPIFEAFEYSITELFPLSGTLLTITAVTVIAVEIIIGLGLLFNKGTRLFSAILSLMMFTFIISLTTALFRYESYICTCFGVLGLKLPVNEQIVVDFILLNMALFVFLFSQSESNFISRLQQRSRKIIIPVLTVSIIWSTLVIVQPRFIFGEKPDIAVDTQKVFNEIPQHEQYQPYLVFMIDMSDFLCPQCLEDFLDMGNQIAAADPLKGETVYFMAKRIEDMTTEELQDYINYLQAEHNFPLSIKVDETDLFTRAGFDKSTVLLYTALGSVEDSETFPMGPRRRNEIMSRFLR